MEKFTKGPWHWSRYDFVDGFYGLYAGDEPVIYPQRCNDGDDGNAWFSMDESYYGETAMKPADAALIAAAPEMYEMLSELSGQLTDINAHAHVRRIERLLAKARGES